ncbi:MAG: 50S ribosomal protein L3 [Firmicutes bacterium]|nr:50S ribosomal protein L3 [Bacillota bacterium]
MANGIIGKKLGMTQIFNEKGQIVPVTVIQAGPCVVVQRKTSAKDGYEAVQVGYVDPQGGKRASKAEKGHCEKKGVAPVRVLRELKVEAGSALKEGDSILVTQFEEKAKVHVTGISKGKGFAGVIKRHHFGGGRATHGSMFHRAPGSIGGSSYPSRVWPGMRMGGHMGSEQVTVRNLEVARVDAENNLLLIKGAVPGPKGGYVVIKQEA